MEKIYTEIRITHKSHEEKKQFEKMLQENIKEAVCTDRADFIRLISKYYYLKHVIKNIKIKEGDGVINKCTGEVYTVVKVRHDDGVIVCSNGEEKRAFGENLTHKISDLEVIK